MAPIRPDSIRQISHARVPRTYAARLRGALAGLCFGVVTTGVCAEQTYPRAETVISAQHLALALEPALRIVPAMATLLAGNAARVEIERDIALLYTALAADGLADSYWQKVQLDASASDDDEALGAALAARIESALGNGEYDLCEKLTAELLLLAQRSADRGLRASAEEYQGVLDRRRGQTISAAAHQQLALQLREQLGDAAGMAIALANLGTIARDRGDFAQALDFNLRSLDIRERIDVRLELAYRNLALLYRELDDRNTTQEYFSKALAAAEHYADPGYYAAVQGTYAGFLNDVHEYDSALAAESEALSISKALNNRPGLGFEHLESGRALLGLKRADEAQTHLLLALDIGRAIDQRELIVRSELLLADAALARGDQAHAHTLLDQAIARPELVRMKPQLAQAYELRDRLAESEHDMPTAHDYAHRYANLREELLGVRSTRQLAAVEVRKAREQAEQQLELAARTNELQTERLQHAHLERTYSIAAIVGLAAISLLFMFLFFGLRRLYRALAARNREIDTQRAALSEANRLLERQATALYQAAISDPLTGVYNRAHLLGQLKLMLAGCEVDERDMALLMIDFDNFKQINDQHGHLTGDRVLVETLRAIRGQLGPESLVGRFGGEEFIVAFTDRDMDASRQIAERLRRSVATAMATLMPELKSMTTISIGVALLSQLSSPRKLETLIDAADRAVYAAKAAGRNQVKGMHVA